METRKTALVLGATGGIGGSIAEALLRHGWTVRGLARSVPSAGACPAPLASVRWIQGDAMVRSDVVEAAAGASVLVHAVNPPGYRGWDTLVLPMLDNTLAAARAAGGARVVLPGTIYNFDPSQTPTIDASTPQHPRSRKGAIRVAMEQRLREAAPQVPSLIVRAGDFFGPHARSSWFAQAMVAPGRPLKRIINPARGAGHSWAYLPDLSEAFARLLDVPERLDPFEQVQFEGLFDASGTTLIDALRRVTGRDPYVLRFPWWLMSLLSPLGGFPREAAEIAPGWRHPVRLDNARLEQLIGPEPRTALDQALQTTLIHMGCLTDPSPTEPLVGPAGAAHS